LVLRKRGGFQGEEKRSERGSGAERLKKIASALGRKILANLAEARVGS